MRHKRTVELVQPGLSATTPFHPAGHPGVEASRETGESGIRAVEVSGGEPTERTEGQPCWIAVYFPDLPLDVLSWPVDRPRVVIVERHNRREVYAACEEAQVAGILPGLPLGTALALRADLAVRVRDETLEQQGLQYRAECCLRVTPTVCLELPDVLLLEVQGSLRLFGDPDEIKWRLEAWLRDGPDEVAQRLAFAVTPTPGASLILARSSFACPDLEDSIVDAGAITSALGELPIRLLLQSWSGSGSEKRPVREKLPPTGRLQRQLDNLGIRTVRELLRLPRDGLRRRFGNEFVSRINKVLGKCPDIRTACRSRLEFSDTLDLEMETDNMLWVATACRALFDKFAAYLREQDALATRLLLRLRHVGAEDTRIYLGHAVGSRDEGDWMSLLDIRLESQVLPAPVTGIGLSSDDIYPYRTHTPDLFGQTGGDWDKGSWNRTMDEIRARLGDDVLTGLAVREERRPELAYSESCKGLAMRPRKRPAIVHDEGDGFIPDRPGWLLGSPRRLSGTAGNKRSFPAGLNIVSRPERIESGWWDDREIRRDYYVAMDSDQRKLWIFRDLVSGDWYLHGVFA